MLKRSSSITDLRRRRFTDLKATAVFLKIIGQRDSLVFSKSAIPFIVHYVDVK